MCVAASSPPKPDERCAAHPDLRNAPSKIVALCAGNSTVVAAWALVDHSLGVLRGLAGVGAVGHPVLAHALADGLVGCRPVGMHERALADVLVLDGMPLRLRHRRRAREPGLGHPRRDEARLRARLRHIIRRAAPLIAIIGRCA